MAKVLSTNSTISLHDSADWLIKKCPDKIQIQNVPVCFPFPALSKFSFTVQYNYLVVLHGNLQDNIFITILHKTHTKTLLVLLPGDLKCKQPKKGHLAI